MAQTARSHWNPRHQTNGNQEIVNGPSVEGKERGKDWRHGCQLGSVCDF